MAVQGSSGLDLLLLFILLSSGAEWRPSCFDGFQLLAASLGLLWKGRHAVLVGFLLLKGRQSLVSPPLLQCPNCPVLKRFRVTDCSLTDCLDENHASCIHFSGLEFYLASQQTECELWLVRMMAGLQPATHTKPATFSELRTTDERSVCCWEWQSLRGGSPWMLQDLLWWN